jgi:hypothetical protein
MQEILPAVTGYLLVRMGWTEQLPAFGTSILAQLSRSE